MLTKYVQGAMRKARYEIISGNEPFYGEIVGFDGVYAVGETLEACRETLEEVLEKWMLLRISMHLPLPIADSKGVSSMSRVHAAHSFATYRSSPV